MNNIAEATLNTGDKIQYIVENNPPRGGMKYTYFSLDKSYVVQFFNNHELGYNPNIKARIEAIIGKYNPTVPESLGGARGNDEKMADYFSKTFCWPVSTIKYPEFGIVCPAYPCNFFFNEQSSIHIDLNGKDKKSNWFTSKNRKYLQPYELGDFRSMLKMSIILARSVRRMHQAGLAHSDLSNNNVLIDPQTGTCVIIDIDSLVVPGLYPPEVVGTRGYIAPEVLETLYLPYNHYGRKSPCSYTDLHALAVLIYEYLLLRHPLIGPKIYSKDSAEEDDFLALGPKATFIENPYDMSNRPKDLKVTIKDLGPELEKLFFKAFINGLHSSNERPTAMEWEKGLVKTWDLLHKCSNPKCEQKWFVLYDINKPICPFCNTKIKDDEIVRFNFKAETRGHSGQWFSVGQMDISNNTPLFKWHIYNNIFPDEKADRTLQAYVCKYKENWILVNQNVNGMLSPKGNIVPSGNAIILKNGTIFKASRGDRGRLIEVSMKEI